MKKGSVFNECLILWNTIKHLTWISVWILHSKYWYLSKYFGNSTIHCTHYKQLNFNERIHSNVHLNSLLTVFYLITIIALYDILILTLDGESKSQSLFLRAKNSASFIDVVMAFDLRTSAFNYFGIYFLLLNLWPNGKRGSAWERESVKSKESVLLHFLEN